jgi:hypothetical protein
MENNLLFDILQRIGSTPRDQLSWLVGLVQYRAPQTAEDWGNLRRELAVFAMHAAGAASLLNATDKDPPKLRDAFADILRRAARRQTIPFLSRPRALGWDASKGRYVETVNPEQDNLRNAVLRGLARRLLECGHLLKECQAPARLRPGRKRKGEPTPEPGVCGRLFVARKRTQLYCSGACLSRTVTRKKRAGKTTKKRKSIPARHKPK